MAAFFGVSASLQCLFGITPTVFVCDTPENVGADGHTPKNFRCHSFLVQAKLPLAKTGLARLG